MKSLFCFLLYKKIPSALNPFYQDAEIKFELSFKFLPCWLTFTVLGGAMHEPGEENTSTVLPSYEV